MTPEVYIISHLIMLDELSGEKYLDFFIVFFEMGTNSRCLRNLIFWKHSIKSIMIWS